MADSDDDAMPSLVQDAPTDAEDPPKRIVIPGAVNEMPTRKLTGSGSAAAAAPEIFEEAAFMSEEAFGRPVFPIGQRGFTADLLSQNPNFGSEDAKDNDLVTTPPDYENLLTRMSEAKVADGKPIFKWVEAPFSCDDCKWSGKWLTCTHKVNIPLPVPAWSPAVSAPIGQVVTEGIDPSKIGTYGG